ncbi:hypothetical protein HMPREF1249_1039 [Jonquetella sp. BV3C21]|nr:hypothetical protein GCWU000246_01105 [Jonquetella anthropi E3_33 E1]ERL23639.1 hypothetical protein HMPREF1249_1039 [Jonquetella sp. BV3C21]
MVWTQNSLSSSLDWWAIELKRKNKLLFQIKWHNYFSRWLPTK